MSKNLYNFQNIWSCHTYFLTVTNSQFHTFNSLPYFTLSLPHSHARGIEIYSLCEIHMGKIPEIESVYAGCLKGIVYLLPKLHWGTLAPVSSVSTRTEANNHISDKQTKQKMESEVSKYCGYRSFEENQSKGKLNLIHKTNICKRTAGRVRCGNDTILSLKVIFW